MTILYTVLVIWVVFGLLLYLETIDTISVILKDEGAVLEVVELSKQYNEMSIIGKVVFFLAFLLTSQFLFVFFMNNPYPIIVSNHIFILSK